MAKALGLPFTRSVLTHTNILFVLLPRFKDGKLIPNRQSQYSMQIKDVGVQNSGTYTLVLRNGQAGLEKSISIQLVVNGKEPTSWAQKENTIMLLCLTPILS